MSGELLAVRVVFTGRVQGVGFRAHLRLVCTSLGVLGWVRNREDGAVEAELVATGARIEAAISKIQSARSHDIHQVTRLPITLPSALSSRFEVRP